MRKCPTTDQLQALLHGKLESLEISTFSDHLEVCSACRDTVEQMTADSDSRRWKELRTASTRVNEADKAILGRMQLTLSRRSSQAVHTSLVRLAAETQLQETMTGHNPPAGYEFMAYLGRGGMGIVYKAMHQSLKRIVAIKMLRAETVADTASRSRLIAEAEIVARLEHPNIAQVFEVGEHAGAPFIALEFVDGPTLSQVLDGKPQGSHDSAWLITILARAAHHAHLRGIVHRDLKPGNVLLARTDAPDRKAEGLASWTVPKITDFGLAKRLDESSITQTGQVLGTPCYMAPEQARGVSGEITPLSDVYALGAILYESLTGRPPHLGLTAINTVVKVLTDEPERPRAINPSVPLDLETICLRCLEKNPNHRYRSAEALAEDLERFMQGQPVLARPLSRMARTWRWMVRNPSAASLLLVVAGIAGIGFPAMTALWLRADSARERAANAETDAVDARQASARQSAGLLADRARQFVEDGKVAEGLNWYVQALAVCPNANDADRAFRDLLEANIMDWSSQLPRPLGSIDIDDIQCATFSHDSRLVATGGADGLIRVWDVGSLQLIGGPFIHDHIVTSIAFSPAGNSLVAGYGLKAKTNTYDGRCLVWNMSTGDAVTLPLLARGDVRVVDWSGDGKHIAIGGGREVWVWDVEKKQLIESPWVIGSKDDESVTEVRFTPDGRGLAVAFGRVYVDRGWRSSGQCVVFDLASGRSTTLVDSPTLRPERLEYSRDQPVIGVSGTRVLKLGPSGQPTPGGARLLPEGFAGLHPDGNTALIHLADRSLRFGDAGSGRMAPGMRTGWAGGVVRMAPSGELFLKHTELWSTPRPTCRPPGNTTLPSPFSSIVFSPKGRVALASRREVILVQSKEGRPLWPPIENAVGRPYWSRDGELLAAALPGHHSIGVWQAESGRAVMAPFEHVGQLGTMAFSPDGRQLALGTYGKHVYLIDLATGKAREPLLTHEIVMAMDFSPDGKWLAVGLSDDWSKSPEVCLIDVENGTWSQSVLPHLDKGLRKVRFNQDGTRLLAVSDAHARLWDFEQRTSVGSPIPVARALADNPFSPDGRWYVCVTATNDVRLMSAATGTAIGPPLVGPAAVTGAQFSPDSRSLLVAYSNCTAQVWDITTFRPRGAPVAQRHSVGALWWAPDGASFYTASLLGAVRHWPVAQPRHFDLESLRLTIEVLTAHRMDVGPATSSLDREEWRSKFKSLIDLHGSIDRILGPVRTDSQWHDDCARDAEEEGNFTLANYHLDRLLALNPKDSWAVVRQACAFAEDGKLMAADSNWQRARALVGDDVVRRWSVVLAKTCECQGRAEAAKWLLRK